jgi:type I restriction enzyme, R subunit
MHSPNQNPEQIARDKIDQLLIQSGWLIQPNKALNLNAAFGVAVREYQTEVGLADYVLFVDKKPVGIIEAKREEEGHRLTIHEAQSTEYAAAKLKYINRTNLPFVYESTAAITNFTDYRDPKPCAREVFYFLSS